MIEYFNEDCMAGMARYPDKYFELCICDPPYGIGEDGGKCRTRGSLKTNGPKKWWDKNRPDTAYFDELFRVSKNQIVFGGNYFADLLFTSRCWIYWQKDMGGDFADGELAWTSFDAVLKQYRQRSETFNRIHPTQKPVALYKWLLTNYAKPGDKILDTHVGSASSLIACHDMGFDAVGFELDPDYYRQSMQRLNDFMAQPRIDTLSAELREQVDLFGRPDYARP
jgi:site-specific DNA-methyltransferase (adenine-specific)